MLRKFLITIFLVGGFSTFLALLYHQRFSFSPSQVSNERPQITPEISLTPEPPTASPTPRPLTFTEMNQKYGPCAVVPTLMYHHIQDINAAEAQGHKWLAVSPENFRSQMAYLRSKGYSVIGMGDLANFFNQGSGLPPKSILITFDDGYADMTDAISILNEFGYKATIFLATGLMENPNYLAWSTIQSASGNILFGNHTWSHQNSFAAEGKIRDEIGKADSQLSGRGLNNPKVFAYPYGPSSPNAEKVLSEFGYQLAFTTSAGSIQCKARRFDLFRIRVGNSPSLSAYGL